MQIVQSPPGAVPFVPLTGYSPLQKAVYNAALRHRIKALEINKRSVLPTSMQLAIEVSVGHGASYQEVIRAIEELRHDGTLLMLPTGRLWYCSDE